MTCSKNKPPQIYLVALLQRFPGRRRGTGDVREALPSLSRSVAPWAPWPRMPAGGTGMLLGQEVHHQLIEFLRALQWHHV